MARLRRPQCGLVLLALMVSCDLHRVSAALQGGAGQRRHLQQDASRPNRYHTLHTGGEEGPQGVAPGSAAAVGLQQKLADIISNNFGPDSGGGGRSSGGGNSGGGGDSSSGGGGGQAAKPRGTAPVRDSGEDPGGRRLQAAPGATLGMTTKSGVHLALPPLPDLSADTLVGGRAAPPCFTL
jgi:hypothetical protein